MKTQGNFLTCETRDGLMDVYVSSQETKTSLPVVIVLQEAFGVNHHIRSLCDRLAAQGFFVAAPELFHRQGRRIEVPYGDRKEFMPLLGALTNQLVLQDVRDTMNFLESLPHADVRKTSVMGFCVGGFAAALVGTKLNVQKVISFYGAGMIHPREGIGLNPIIEDLGQIKAKCLFFFGGLDASIPRSEVQEIEKKLTESKVSFEVDIFKDSDHGFFCDERKTYHPQNAKISWDKSVSFLRE